MSYSYKAVVTTAPYTWTSTAGDEPSYGLADPLTVTRSIPEGDLWPAQPAPARAVFNVIAESYANVSNLTIGMPVQVRYYSPSTDTEPLENFAGRITDLVVRPHRLGIILTVTCIDYLADIAEHEVRPAPSDGSVYGPFNAASGLIDQIWDLSGIPVDPPTIFATYTDLDNDPLVLVPFNGGNLATLVDQYLTQWIVDETGYGLGVARFVIVPNTDGPDLEGFDLVPIFRNQPSSAWVDTLNLDAGKVDVGGSFTRRKGTTIDVVAVNYSPDTVAAQAVADYYVPTGTAPGWVADDFTWRLHDDAEGAYLPFGYTGNVRLAYPVNVTDIDERWCPTGTTYSGLLSGYTLTIANGKPELSLTLHPPVFLAP